MGSGKIVAIVGAIIGILSVTLGLVLPEWMGWWRYLVSGAGATSGYVVNGFGMLTNVGVTPPPPPEIALFFMVLIGGIMVLAGSAILIIGAVKESKVVGLIGGIVLLLGPMLLVLDLLIGIGDYSMILLPGTTVFWGSYEVAPGVFLNWGIGIGAFMAIGAGAVGIIGGATI